jgi:hypothetical protein
MKTVALLASVLALVAALGGCMSQTRRETPVGHACYRQFAYDTYPRYYGCLFELSAPSAFYDDSAIMRVLSSFTASEGGVCVVQPERDVADVRTQHIDHGLRFRLFNVECK